MAITQNTYTGNGSTVLYSFTFPYLETTDIKVSLNGVNTTAYTLANATTVQFNSAPANGAAIRIYRQTDDAGTKATFFPGSAIRSQDLNDNFLQVLYKSQETETFAASTDASAIQATANTALSNANTALTNSNTALTTANGIASTANTALGNSAAAVSTANAALPKSGGTMTGNITFNGTQTFPNSGLQQATTGQQGIVQLTDSTSSTSTTTAATPNSVKSAFDTASAAQTTANAALPLSGGTLTGNLTVPSINGGPLAGSRNRIINGDMRIDQRNAGASVSVSSNAFIADRWVVISTGGGVIGAQQDSTIALSGFTHALKAVVTTADTSIASTDEYGVYQNIEGLNVADFNFGKASASTITISFWVYSSVAGSYGFALKNNANTRSYPTSYTVNSANTWEYKTITIAGDTTGTWLSTNGKGLECHWSLGAGTNFKTTGNAWTAGNYSSATGTTNWIATNGAVFYLTGAQVELGSVATPFERRNYGQELSLCFRYCRPVSHGTYGRVTGSNTICFFPAFDQMRVSPTVSLTAGSIVGDSGNTSATASSPSVSSTSIGLTGGRIFIGGFSGLITNDNFPLAPTGATILLSSEL